MLLSIIVILQSCSSITPHCSENWKTTGFYTPVETMNGNKNETIQITPSSTKKFDSSFLKKVKVEGWGKTRFGWYLGYYNNRWHRSNYPLNAKGKPLKLGMVAVDNKVIPKGQELVIPGIKSKLGIDTFIAEDVGSAIKAQHIDIYTGEGEKARLLSYDVTGEQMVCFTSNTTRVPVIELGY